MAGNLRTRQKERFSLPFSVYRRKNDRSVTILILETGKYTREKDVAGRAPAKNGKGKSNF